MLLDVIYLHSFQASCLSEQKSDNFLTNNSWLTPPTLTFGHDLSMQAGNSIKYF